MRSVFQLIYFKTSIYQSRGDPGLVLPYWGVDLVKNGDGSDGVSLDKFSAI